MPSPSRTAAAFLGPHLALFTLWTLVPLAMVLTLSLYDWNLLGDRRFIGLDNYREMLGDRSFWLAIGNTLRFGAVMTPLAIAGGLALAVALNPPQRGRGLLRAVFYTPGIVSGVATATVFAWILNTNYGVLNGVLVTLGLPREDWLDSSRGAFWVLTFTTVWMRVGFCMLVYLAGLQEIPADLYEAARVDGASAWLQFSSITWPLLRRSTLLLAVLNIVFSFQIFDLAYVMTGGGPAFSTTMLVQYLYDTGFSLQRQGYAAAVSIALFTLMLIFTAVAALVEQRRAK